jgi:hypothetical protein
MQTEKMAPLDVTLALALAAPDAPLLTRRSGDRERFAANMRTALDTKVGRTALKDIARQSLASLRQERRSTLDSKGVASQAGRLYARSFQR